jgi:hypothetical protein
MLVYFNAPAHVTMLNNVFALLRSKEQVLCFEIMLQFTKRAKQKMYKSEHEKL